MHAFNSKAAEVSEGKSFQQKAILLKEISFSGRKSLSAEINSAKGN